VGRETSERIFESAVAKRFGSFSVSQMLNRRTSTRHLLCSSDYRNLRLCEKTDSKGTSTFSFFPTSGLQCLVDPA
jgi:hypothetical protein